MDEKQDSVKPLSGTFRFGPYTSARLLTPLERRALTKLDEAAALLAEASQGADGAAGGQVVTPRKTKDKESEAESTRRWTPVLRANGAYCSPACGGGPEVCSLARYKRARAAADAVAKDLGKGWVGHTIENLGWHAKVSSPCKRIWISLDGAQNGKVIWYTAFLGPPRDMGGNARWAEAEKTARAAIEAVLKAVQDDLGLVHEIVAGLTVPSRLRGRRTTQEVPR